MVSGRVLDNKTLVALHSLELERLLDSPFADVGPFLVLVGTRGSLLRVGGLPSLLPVVRKLLKEVGLEGGRLWCKS